MVPWRLPLGNLMGGEENVLQVFWVRVQVLALSTQWGRRSPGGARGLCRVKPSRSWPHLLLLDEFVVKI